MAKCFLVLEMRAAMEPNLTQSLYLPIIFLIYEIIVGTLVYRRTESVLLDRQTDGWIDGQIDRQTAVLKIKNKKLEFKISIINK